MNTTKKDIRFNRERFDRGAKFYATKGIAPQQAQLRVAVPFAASTGTYKFDIKKDASIALAIEMLLKRNDLFVARAIGMGIMVEPTAAKGTAPIYSYPVQAGLALPTGLKGLTDTNAYAMYNGLLSMKTGQTVNFSRFPVNKFLYVPEVQPEGLFNTDTKAVISKLVQPAFTIAGEAYTQAFAVLVVEGWLYEGGTTEDCHSAANPYNDCF